MRRALSLPLALLLAACGEPSDTTSDTTVDASTDASAGASTTTGDSQVTGDDSTSDTPPTTTGAPTTDPTTGAPTTDPTTGDDPSGSTTATTLTTGDDTGVIEELPPTESAEILEAWLAGGAYKSWAVESKVHGSTGPHGGNVRTYVNAIALASLAADNAEHPQDSATVKELYGNSVDTIIGYAVGLKTAPTSEGGATWYWYERLNGTTYADGLGVGLCTGCHGGGADYILTPYPLQ
jgi:hypothetical protein